MKKNIKLFLLFSKYALKITFQHPLGGFSFLFGKIARFAMYFLFVSYLLHQTKFLAGYSIIETLIFFITFNIIDSLAQLLFREVYRFRPLIVNGELDGILIKPYHPFMRILVGGIDYLDLIMIALYCFLLFYYIAQLPSISFIGIVLFFAMISNAMIIATAFHIIVLALGILTTEVDHAVMIYRDITRMGTLPIDIYSEPVRTIFTFFIPIGVMITFPVKSLLMKLPFHIILLSFMIGLSMLYFSLQLWDRALKKYQSWGG